jgi:hypothetical protein
VQPLTKAGMKYYAKEICLWLSVIDKTDTVVPVTDCLIAVPKITSKTRKPQRSRKIFFEENDSSVLLYRGNPKLNTNSFVT